MTLAEIKTRQIDYLDELLALNIVDQTTYDHFKAKWEAEMHFDLWAKELTV